MNVRKTIDYGKLFEDVDRAVNAALPQMELYREIGRLICERPEKGAAAAVAEHLQSAYSDTSGFSPRNVRRMREFYRMYKNARDIMREAMGIGWTQNVVILEANLPLAECEWYIRATQRFDWSKLVLAEKIAQCAHKTDTLDSKDDICYTVFNKEISEDHSDQGAFYLPREYLKGFPKSLYFQWVSVLKCPLLHHYYTTLERALNDNQI